MDDAEIAARLGQGSGYTDLPGRHVTINQIVAWNLSYWRKAAGLTQEELGQLLGWSKVVVSAAERSWDGKRVRMFTADDIVNLADALEVPVAALLLPPENDGTDIRYLFHLRDSWPSMCHNMYDLLGYVMSEPSDDDTPVMKRYRDRYVAALNFYLGAGPEQTLEYVEDLTTEERIVSHLERLRAQYDALRELLSDNDKLQEALGRRLGEMRRDSRVKDQRTSPRRAREAAIAAVGRELFGASGPASPEERRIVINEVRKRGVLDDANSMAMLRDEDSVHEVHEESPAGEDRS